MRTKKQNKILFAVTLLSAFALTNAATTPATPPEDLSHLKPMSIPKADMFWKLYRGLPLEPKKSTMTSLTQQINDLKGKTSSEEQTKLALAYIDYGLLYHRVEEIKFDYALEKWNTGPKKTPQPVLDHKQSDGYLKMARGILEKAYNSNKKAPAAAFNYGAILAMMVEPLAVNVLDTLSETANKEPYYYLAEVAMAEYYFAREEFDLAIREFQRAIKGKAAFIAPYTQYKTAWIDYLKAKGAKAKEKQLAAVNNFVKILSKQQASEDPKAKVLAQRMEVDVIGMVADIGDQNYAKRLLTELDRVEAYEKTLERMALIKYSSGDKNGAYSIYSKLLTDNPASPAYFRIASNMLQIVAEVPNIPFIQKNLERSVADLLGPKSIWQKNQTPEQIEKVKKQLEEQVFTYATDIDKLARDPSNPKNRSFLQNAAKLYVLYAKTFPKTERTPDVKLYLAQIYYDQKMYAKSAGVLFHLLKKHPEYKAKKDAGELMVSAAQYAVDGDKSVAAIKFPEQGTIKEPMKLPASSKLYVSALEMFIKSLPKHENVAPMEYVVAKTYFDFGHYDKAVPHFERIMKVYQTNEYAPEAAIKLLVLYNTQGEKDKFKDTQVLISQSSFKSNPKLVEVQNQFKSQKVAAGKKPATKTAEPAAEPSPETVSDLEE